tara:strand:+ start:4110 stop:4325 length:216 start_codon:yes stop_codon:yes gene_type:complete
MPLKVKKKVKKAITNSKIGKKAINQGIKKKMSKKPIVTATTIPDAVKVNALKPVMAVPVKRGVVVGVKKKK